jgi:hypothetical protein
VLVGKFSSNVDRLALSLMTLRHEQRRRGRAAPPPLGWCSAAAAAAATSDDGGGGGGGGGGGSGGGDDSPTQSIRSAPSAPPLWQPPWPAGEAAPRLCVPPFISLDHPWCAEWFQRVPLATLGPQTYGGPAADADAVGRIVGGFQC